MKRKMYATVRRYEGVKDPVEAAKQVDKKFVPFISSLPGFIEYYWIDLNDSAMISITIFKTLPDAISANNEARKFVKEHLNEFLPSAIRVEAGTIVAHKG